MDALARSFMTYAASTSGSVGMKLSLGFEGSVKQCLCTDPTGLCGADLGPHVRSYVFSAPLYLYRLLAHPPSFCVAIVSSPADSTGVFRGALHKQLPDQLLWLASADVDEPKGRNHRPLRQVHPTLPPTLLIRRL